MLRHDTRKGIVTETFVKGAISLTLRAVLLRRTERRSLLLVLFVVWCIVGYRAMVLGCNSVDLDQAAPIQLHWTVDPNVADWPSLAELPGIGPRLAERIVAFREHSRFHSIDDLMKVKGIGPKKVAGFTRYIKIR